MYENEWLESSLSLYKLYMQTDGNLVARDMNTNSAFWSTGTSGDGVGGYYIGC